MKKYFLLGLMVALAPNMCLGESARYTQLVREKQRKMEELEKCMGATKGLKIAGISTLGLTAVGVAGNIVEAKKRNEYDADIKKADKKISGTQQEIEKVDEAITQKNAEIEQQRLQEQQLQQQLQQQVVQPQQQAGSDAPVVQQGTPQEQPKGEADPTDPNAGAQNPAGTDNGSNPSAENTAVGQLNVIDPSQNQNIATQLGVAALGGTPKLNIDVPAMAVNPSGNNSGNNTDAAPKATGDDAFTKNCKDTGGTPSGYGTCFCTYGFTADATGRCVVNFGKNPTNTNTGNAGNNNPQPVVTNPTQEDTFTKNCKDTGGTPSGYGTCWCQSGFTADATGKCVKNFGGSVTPAKTDKPAAQPKKEKPATTTNTSNTPSTNTTNTNNGNSGTTIPKQDLLSFQQQDPIMPVDNTYVAPKTQPTIEPKKETSTSNKPDHCAALRASGEFKTVTTMSDGRCKVDCGYGKYLDTVHKKCESQYDIPGNTQRSSSGIISASAAPASTSKPAPKQNNTPQQRTNTQIIDDTVQKVRARDNLMNGEEVCWQKVDSYDGIDTATLMLDGSCAIKCKTGYAFNTSRNRCEKGIIGLQTGYIK
jgi:hypothetical protein